MHMETQTVVRPTGNTRHMVSRRILTLLCVFAFRLRCPLTSDRRARYTVAPASLRKRSMLMYRHHRDFLESLDDGTSFSQPPAVAPSLMSSPTYTNPVALGVDNPYITQPTGPTNTASTNTGAHIQQPASPDRDRDRSAEEPAVVLPAATKTERFFLTAADQASGSRNERLNMVIRSKYEAGLLKPYNYVKGYARLSRWMDRKCVLLRLCDRLPAAEWPPQRITGIKTEDPATPVCPPPQVQSEPPDMFQGRF